MQDDLNTSPPPETPARGPLPKLPCVAIVGRPNVGKSALFNRIARQRLAIVAQESGTTRDRVATTAEWFDRHFVVFDTGGLGIFRHERAENLFDELIREQLIVAVEGADLVIQVVDVQVGVAPLDREVAEFLRERGKRVIVAANKADNPEQTDLADEFAALGFAEVVPISCEHNRNLDELLQRVTADLPPAAAEPFPELLRIAVIGRPNVGKSSVVNRLLGEERVIVSDIPGTTRDAVDVPFSFTVDDQVWHACLIDTAGLRKRGKVEEAVEYFSSMRTEQAIERADVVVLVLDASTPVTAQDKRIARMASDSGKPCLLLVNKWDLATGKLRQNDMERQLSEELPFMDYAYRLVACATSGYNFPTLLHSLAELAAARNVQAPTSLVNRVITDAVMRLPPPVQGNKAFKVYYSLFKPGSPPRFIIFVNEPTRCQNSYRTYLAHQLRRAFGFKGVPLEIELRERREENKRPIPPGISARLQEEKRVRAAQQKRRNRRS